MIYISIGGHLHKIDFRKSICNLVYTNYVEHNFQSNNWSCVKLNLIEKEIIKMISSPNCALHGGSTLGIKLKKTHCHLKISETPFKQKKFEVSTF